MSEYFRIVLCQFKEGGKKKAYGQENMKNVPQNLFDTKINVTLGISVKFPQ